MAFLYTHAGADLHVQVAIEIYPKKSGSMGQSGESLYLHEYEESSEEQQSAPLNLVQHRLQLLHVCQDQQHHRSK